MTHHGEYPEFKRVEVDQSIVEIGPDDRSAKGIVSFQNGMWIVVGRDTAGAYLVRGHTSPVGSPPHRVVLKNSQAGWLQIERRV